MADQLTTTLLPLWISRAEFQFVQAFAEEVEKSVTEVLCLAKGRWATLRISHSDKRKRTPGILVMPEVRWIGLTWVYAVGDATSSG